MAPLAGCRLTPPTAASRMVSYGDLAQLVKVLSARRRQDSPVQRHHDAVLLKALDGTAQRRWLHIADFGLELGARPSLVVVVA